MAKFSRIYNLMGEAMVEFVYDDVTKKLENIKTSIKNKKTAKMLRVFFGDIYTKEKKKDDPDEDFKIPKDKEPTYTVVETIRPDGSTKTSIRTIEWYTTYGI